MKRLTENSLARFILTCEYRSHHCFHSDHYYCGSVNLWRDFFRPEHMHLLLGLAEGDNCTLVNGETITYDPIWRVDIKSHQWRPHGKFDQLSVPRQGRWYPQGFLAEVDNIYPQSRQPMRIVAIEGETITADCNHPLADVAVTVKIHVDSLTTQDRERGGRCTDWLEEALGEGPGMQLLRGSARPDFHEPDQFVRSMENDDQLFYEKSRLVNHIDKQTQAHLLSCTEKSVVAGDRVLDLMSSINSHLPSAAVVTGLGMNMEELQVNERLQERVVHDLNSNPILPFDDSIFDLVCCHLSFEYLLQPKLVMREVARVLRPGGGVFISFANRWFPEKVTRIWTKLHEFERMGYVLDYLRDYFDDFGTTSFRNWPRPEDDPHYFELHLSDPLYVVTGYKK